MTVQAVAGATAMQLLVWEKSAELVPENEAPVTLSGRFPVLVRVRGREDELPGSVGGKANDAGREAIAPLVTLNAVAVPSGDCIANPLGNAAPEPTQDRKFGVPGIATVIGSPSGAQIPLPLES